MTLEVPIQTKRICLHWSLPPMPVLNIEESDFLERTDKLLEKDNKWEAHVAHQVPLPRFSSSYPDNNQTRPLEQVEPETEDNMDMRDFSKRTTNDKRPPKSPQKPKVMLQNLIPPPGCLRLHGNGCCHVTGIPKLQHIEIRGITPEKKKVSRGWPACLKRSPPRLHFTTKTYMQNTQMTAEHHYEEPKGEGSTRGTWSKTKRI